MLQSDRGRLAITGRSVLLQSMYCLWQKPRRKRTLLFSFKTSEIEFPVLKWLGELTPYQAEVSEKLLETYQKQKDSLVHAVTGAGKTEMIYKIVAYVLEVKVM